MTRYSGTPDYEHGSPARVGILLVNLGTPDDPSPRSVRKYLAEFLWDPRIIEMPRALWWMILHGVILRVRPRRSARAYRKIWTARGSPLMIESQALTRALAMDLAGRFGDRVAVELAMTYGQPSVRSALDRLRDLNVQRLIVLPLYPQFSSTTTGSIFEQVTRELGRRRWMPELRFVNQYWQNERYLAAIADSVAASWRAHGRKHLVFSFHSIPKRYLLAGDPYHCFCHGTAREVAARLGLAPNEWSIGFQSRFGREEWLKPYMDALLNDFSHAGPRQVTLVCPGFATDCLETLEEIGMQYREMFLGHGGEAFDYVPCLNSSAGHVAALADVVLQHGQGWPEFSGTAPDQTRLTAARDRALALGAVR